MNAAWSWLKSSLTADDLFVRVLALLFGFVLSGLGACGVYWMLAHDSSNESTWFILALWSTAAFFAVWGALLLIRGLAPANSRLGRLSERFLPDSADEGGLVIIAFCIPAVAITLLLRLLGIRGSSLPPRHDA